MRKIIVPVLLIFINDLLINMDLNQSANSLYNVFIKMHHFLITVKSRFCTVRKPGLWQITKQKYNKSRAHKQLTRPKKKGKEIFRFLSGVLSSAASLRKGSQLGTRILSNLKPSLISPLVHFVFIMKQILFTKNLKNKTTDSVWWN